MFGTSECEGCEYNVVLEAKRKILRKFKTIKLEYHYGYENLENKLKRSGFKVKHTIPVLDLTHSKPGYLGIIDAERQ